MQSPQFPKWILIWKLLFSNFSSAYKWTDYIHFGQTVLCLQQSCEARAYAWATKWVVLCLLFLSWTKWVTHHSIQQHNKWHELCVRKLDPWWVPAYLKRSKKSATYVMSVCDQASSDFGGKKTNPKGMTATYSLCYGQEIDPFLKYVILLFFLYHESYSLHDRAR